MHFPHYLPFHHFFTNLCCLKNSLKQILSLCFDTELLLVPQVPVPSPWLFQPLLYMRWKHKTPDQAMTLVKHQVLVCTPHWLCLVCSSDQTGLTTEPAPGLVSRTLATLHPRAVPVQLCSSFPDSHFSDTNSQGHFAVQSPAQLPPFKASPCYS